MWNQRASWAGGYLAVLELLQRYCLAAPFALSLSDRLFTKIEKSNKPAVAHGQRPSDPHRRAGGAGAALLAAVIFSGKLRVFPILLFPRGTDPADRPELVSSSAGGLHDPQPTQ